MKKLKSQMNSIEEEVLDESVNNYPEQNDLAKKYDKQFLQVLWQNL